MRLEALGSEPVPKAPAAIINFLRSAPHENAQIVKVSGFKPQ
jgi:hypothetical protein